MALIFERRFEALEPTVIQSQGRGASWSTHQAIEGVLDDVKRIDDHIARVRIGGVEAVWCSLKHPALNWGSSVGDTSTTWQRRPPAQRGSSP